jgi:ribosome-binding factor A
MRDFSRTERLGDEFRNEISQMLLREVHDPRLSKVSVTAVDISDCLTFARVYWVLISAEQPEEKKLRRVSRALEKASGFFRSQLADRMPQRTVPELRFVFDESIERGRRMEKIVASFPEEEKASNDSNQS